MEAVKILFWSSVNFSTYTFLLQTFNWRAFRVESVILEFFIIVLCILSSSGTYSAEHPTIQVFWQVLRGFDETQKRQLLKFVTSCSRPPLLGFKVSCPLEDDFYYWRCSTFFKKIPSCKDFHRFEDHNRYHIFFSIIFRFNMCKAIHSSYPSLLCYSWYNW